MPPKKTSLKKKPKAAVKPVTALLSSDSAVSLPEKEHLFEQLTQLSRLASLGSLSSGIAHEINNPLVAVKGFAQLIEMDSEATPRMKEQAREIIDASVRIQKICDHLRSFAKEIHKDEWVEVDLNQTIHQALVLLSQQLRYRRINVTLDLDPSVLKVWGIRNALERVFHNLLTNSRDAFSGVDDGRKRQIKISTEPRGSDVQVIYEDNAGGISNSIRQKVFEPFSTTKRQKSAAGLGLAIVLDIVNEHQGSLGLETDEGGGTTLTLRFPIKSEPKLVSIEGGKKASAPETKWKMLIIDDEPVAAEVLALYSQELFSSEVCVDSKAALRLIEKHTYDLIVTDLNMPDVTGLDIIKAVKERGLKTPVVVMSGYGDADEEVNEAMSQGASAFLQKPFDGPKEVTEFLKGWVMSTRVLKVVRNR